MGFKIFSVVAVVVIVLGLFINSRSDKLEVSRSIVIEAPAAEIFEYVNNFRGFVQWSPWADLDPDAEYTFSGPERGVGAAFSWKGNSKIGEGTDTIIKSVPNSLVEVRLDFVKPFPSTSTADFTFEELESGTKVTWTMYGKKNFIMKAMSLVMDCEKMMGDQFTDGLTNLKNLVETNRS